MPAVAAEAQEACNDFRILGGPARHHMSTGSLPSCISVEQLARRPASASGVPDHVRPTLQRDASWHALEPDAAHRGLRLTLPARHLRAAAPISVTPAKYVLAAGAKGGQSSSCLAETLQAARDHQEALRLGAALTSSPSLIRSAVVLGEEHQREWGESRRCTPSTTAVAPATRGPSERIRQADLTNARGPPARNARMSRPRSTGSVMLSAPYASGSASVSSSQRLGPGGATARQPHAMSYR